MMPTEDLPAYSIQQWKQDLKPYSRITNNHMSIKEEGNTAKSAVVLSLLFALQDLGLALREIFVSGFVAYVA